MHRKVIAFDFDHDMHRLQQVGQRSMATFQELVNEVFAGKITTLEIVCCDFCRVQRFAYPVKKDNREAVFHQLM